MDARQFLDGQIACQNGEECPVGAHPDFERGYATEYTKQQIEDAKTSGHSD